VLHSENESTQSVPMNIAIAHDVFNTDWMLYGGDSGRRIVFVDEYFYSLGEWYGKINDYFIDRGIEATIIPVSCSEDKKDLENLMFILGAIERFNLLRRNEPIIAIGGGVLMDMVGFAASIFRRGVPYIKVPTTLLGLIDAGLGAKTSINHFGRRNRLGSYFPPIVTIIDKQFLKTLDKNEMRFAMGEIIKIAVIKDKQLFDTLFQNVQVCLSTNFECDAADFIIRRSVNAMMEELVPNLWEKELKRVVDFGHTFSPIPEMESLKDDSVYTLSHGEAVALDVLLSSKISMKRGVLSEIEYGEILDVTHRSGLITTHPYFQDPYMLWDSLLDATRHRNGNQNAPIPIKIGVGSFLQDITLEEIKECLSM
jgi:3-dehydroquinate synthetase